MRIPEKVTSDDIKSSSSENIRQVALLASGKSQKKPLAANKKSIKQNQIVSSRGFSPFF